MEQTKFSPLVTGWWEDQRFRDRVLGSWDVRDMDMQWGAWGSSYLPRNIKVFQYFDNQYGLYEFISAGFQSYMVYCGL